MLRIVIIFISLCMVLSSCASFKQSEFVKNEGHFKNYQKNYTFTVPAGYAPINEENKEFVHRLFSDFAPKDSDYFFNKESEIILLCFKGETVEIPLSENMEELFQMLLRNVRFEVENSFKNHSEIKLESIENIDNFITINATSINDLDDTSIKMKLTLYPISKLSRTYAVFFLGMGIPIEIEAKGESDLKQIMTSLKLTAFDRSERITK